MKWYKQDTKSHTDEKMRDLIFKFGLSGYAVYIICLEVIAEKIGASQIPKISISDRVLREKLRLSHQKLTKILSFFDQNLLIFSNFDGEYWNLDCPNLLTRLDNWTLRSVVATKKLPIQKEQEEEVEKKNKKELSFSFDSLWSKYPSKDGKKEAERHFKASVKTEDDFKNIQTALDNYLVHLELPQNAWKQPQAGKTWFNNWQDWVEWNEPERRETDEERDRRLLAEYDAL